MGVVIRVSIGSVIGGTDPRCCAALLSDYRIWWSSDKRVVGVCPTTGLRKPKHSENDS